MEALSKESITQNRISLYAHKEAAQVFTVSAIIIVCLYINLYGVCDVDEMYKFSATRALAMGKKMYTEINMIETPLYFILAAFPLRLNDSFLMYRIVSAILYGCTGYLSYLVMKDDAKHPKLAAYITVALVFSITHVAGYNLLIYMFLLAAAYIYKVNGLTDRTVAALGLDVALIILTKHTVGGVAFVLFSVFLIYKETELSTYIKYFVTPVAFTCLLFAMELGIHGELDAFLDQCIYGIRTFAYNNTDVDSMPIFLASALALAAMAVIRRRKDEDMDILHVVAATTYIIGFPIADYQHMVYSAAVSVMVLMMAFGNYIDEGHFAERDDIFIKWIFLGAIIVVVELSIALKLLSIHADGYIMDGTFTGFHDTTVTAWARDLHEKISRDYDDEEYIIIAKRAATYSTYRNVCQNEFDIFLEGNIGTRRPEKCIEKVLQEGRKVVIEKDYGHSAVQQFTGIQDYLNQNHKRLRSYADMDGHIYDVYGY